MENENGTQFSPAAFTRQTWEVQRATVLHGQMSRSRSTSEPGHYSGLVGHITGMRGRIASGDREAFRVLLAS